MQYPPSQREHLNSGKVREKGTRPSVHQPVGIHIKSSPKDGSQAVKDVFIWWFSLSNFHFFSLKEICELKNSASIYCYITTLLKQWSK